ncbi:hypothetical protein N7528_009046 [Penicillium herquei]|nr:hypothetical protein N7528_009046 [Penicillium herquei]
MPEHRNGRENDDSQKLSDRARDPIHAEKIAMNSSLETKKIHLTKILTLKGGRFLHRKEPPEFYFHGRVVHRPKSYLFRRCGYKSPPPTHASLTSLVCYVHYTSINGTRRNRKYGPMYGPKGKENKISHKIWLKKVTQMTPKDWTRDPYFLSHLLALAQFDAKDPSTPKKDNYTARLIVTNMIEREYIHLYEATIPSEVLNALQDPKNAPNPPEWPTIWKKDIPYKPYDTFADRLVAELVAPPLSSPRKLPIIPSTGTSEDPLENEKSTIAATLEEPTTEVPKKDIETQSSDPYQDPAPQPTENFFEGSRKRSCTAEDDKPNKTRREGIEHEVSVS